MAAKAKIKIKEIKSVDEIPNRDDFKEFGTPEGFNSFVITNEIFNYYKRHSDEEFDDLVEYNPIGYLINSDEGENKEEILEKVIKQFIGYRVVSAGSYQKIKNFDSNLDMDQEKIDEYLDDIDYCSMLGTLQIIELENKNTKAKIIIDYDCFDIFDTACSNVNNIYIIKIIKGIGRPNKINAIKEIKNLKEIPNRNDFKKSGKPVIFDSSIITKEIFNYYKKGHHTIDDFSSEAECNPIGHLVESDMGKNRKEILEKVIKQFIGYEIVSAKCYQKIKNFDPDWDQEELDDYLDDEDYGDMVGTLQVIKLKDKNKKAQIIVDYNCLDVCDENYSEVNNIYIIKEI